MAYILGDQTLPDPISISRRQVEIQTDVTTISGRTARDHITRKEQYVLAFEALTQAQVSNILSERNKNAAVNFSSTESNLTISATPVLIDIQERRYNIKGGSYREDLTLVLTEVS